MYGTLQWFGLHNSFLVGMGIYRFKPQKNIDI